MGSLGLLAISRNEGHLLKEFFDHYLWQGIDHFYIIDNASTDNSHEIYEQYKSVLTLIHEPRVVNVDVLDEGDVQVVSYKKMLHDHIKTDWIYICDMDEFAYARRGFKTIKDFLNEHGASFDQYLMKMKTFNSNGHIAQPESIVHGFTKRHLIPESKNVQCLPTKAIVRVSSLYKPNITHSMLKHPGRTVDSTLTSWVKNRDLTSTDITYFMRTVSEKIYEDSYIISNHYTVQSKEFYFNNKALRGRASRPMLVTGESAPFYQTEWERIEKKQTIDDFELSELTKSKT